MVSGSLHVFWGWGAVIRRKVLSLYMLMPQYIRTEAGGALSGNTSSAAMRWFEEVRGRAACGGAVEFSPQGFSMWPALRPGVDTVRVRRADAYRVSDIVLASCSEPRGIFLHRVAGVRPDGLVLMGDSNLYQTEFCRYEDIAGKVVGLRRGGRELSGSFSWRVLAAVQRLPGCFRRLCVRLCTMSIRKRRR